jgi:hypothetical protein
MLETKVPQVTLVQLVPKVKKQLVFLVPKVHPEELVPLDTLLPDNSRKVLLDQLAMENLVLLVPPVVMEVHPLVLKFIVIQ